MYSLAQNHIYSGFSLCLFRRGLSDVLGGCLLGYCCCLVTKFCPALCDPMDCNMPGLPILHYLPEFAQTHVHWISDAIQPSHPLSSPSPPAFNLSQSLFQWVSSLHQVVKVLELQLQTSIDPVNTLLWSPCYQRDSQESSPAPWFKSISFSALRFLYGPTLTSICDHWKNHSFE